jgi:hypothetical protein
MYQRPPVQQTLMHQKQHQLLVELGLASAFSRVGSRAGLIGELLACRFAVA